MKKRKRKEMKVVYKAIVPTAEKQKEINKIYDSFFERVLEQRRIAKQKEIRGL